ncbi:MAG: hypothetical protein OJF60_001774 [Burkholderiaceae bacterium]|nr:MAG: hypothetical protein OJF60_001774 [Burkholderiaceae bacterium]
MPVVTPTMQQRRVCIVPHRPTGEGDVGRFAAAQSLPC